MKALLSRRWLIVGGGAAVAAGLPPVLLQQPAVIVPPAPPTIVTSLPAVSPPMLDMAIASPPFSPTRTADTEPLAIGTQPPAAAPAAPPAAPTPTLVGTIVPSRGSGVALLRDASGETKSLKVGEMIGEWRLVSIGPSRAVVIQGDRRETLTLNYGDPPTSPSPTPPVPGIPS